MIVIFCWRALCLEASFKKREREMKRKMYELAILKELGERIGYSLNIPSIIDVISGSLSQFIKYSAVSYMLIEQEKIIFKIHFEESVSKKFVGEMKERMTASLSALLNKKINKNRIKEIVSGAVLIEDFEEPVRSFFNIPLVIGDKAVGVLTVAHTKAGLYKEEDMTILYKIVQQVSSAVTRLEAVVETEQKKLNAMVASMTEGVVMTDKDYKIVVVNPAVKKALGLADKEDVSIFDFIDKLGGKFDIRGKLEESVKFNKLLSARDVLIGDKFWQIMVAPVKSAGAENRGEILGGVVIFHDATQERELERMREDFTSMIVHELRSPLTGIKKAAEFMGDSNVREDKSAYADYVRMIHQSAAEMLELVSDLLDVAKIESGKFDLNAEKSKIADLIRDRVKFFTALAKDAKIKLSFRDSGNLPDSASFDPKRIIQVLNNLISNALKFTSAGGEVAVQALLHRQGEDLKKEGAALKFNWFLAKSKRDFKDLKDSVLVAVTDNGVGISQSGIKEIFNKFKQIQKTSAQSEIRGTGLGLSVAKGIIEAHGGIIGVESREGEGSTFYFTIPL